MIIEPKLTGRRLGVFYIPLKQFEYGIDHIQRFLSRFFILNIEYDFSGNAYKYTFHHPKIDQSHLGSQIREYALTYDIKEIHFEIDEVENATLDWD